MAAPTADGGARPPAIGSWGLAPPRPPPERGRHGRGFVAPSPHPRREPTRSPATPIRGGYASTHPPHGTRVRAGRPSAQRGVERGALSSPEWLLPWRAQTVPSRPLSGKYAVRRNPSGEQGVGRSPTGPKGGWVGSEPYCHIRRPTTRSATRPAVRVSRRGRCSAACGQLRVRHQQLVDRAAAVAAGVDHAARGDTHDIVAAAFVQAEHPLVRRVRQHHVDAPRRQIVDQPLQPQLVLATEGLLRVGGEARRD